MCSIVTINHYFKQNKIKINETVKSGENSQILAETIKFDDYICGDEDRMNLYYDDFNWVSYTDEDDFID